jgi:hypothetical protein
MHTTREEGSCEGKAYFIKVSTVTNSRGIGMDGVGDMRVHPPSDLDLDLRKLHLPLQM